jgi:sulfatase maturation enzyme AslB (radical SAM superfamily)
MIDHETILTPQQIRLEGLGTGCYDYLISAKDNDFREYYGRTKEYEEYRKNWGKYPVSIDDFPRVPYQIDVDLADACNLQCTYCFDRTRQRTGKVMNEATLNALIEQIRIHPIFSLSLGFCAEPLLRFDHVKRLFDVARPVCGVHDLIIHTNGLLLNKEVAAYLTDIEATLICISIDATDKETYKKLCKSDQYEQLIDNVTFLKEYRDRAGKRLPMIRTSMVLVPDNLNKEDIFTGIWENIADKIEFQRYRNVCGTMTAVTEEKPTRTVCPWPFMRMSVWPDGTLGVCPFTGSLNTDIALPFNIGTSDIAAVWSSPRLQSIRSRLFKGINGTCLSCVADFERL